MTDLEEIPRVKRGRPKNVVMPPVLTEEICVEYKHIARGRPRSVDIINFKEYQKEYYERNKEKTKGDYLCETCKLLCSKANKSRHNAKYHPKEIL